jgi:hypothetical protein
MINAIQRAYRQLRVAQAQTTVLVAEGRRITGWTCPEPTEQIAARALKDR